ncbi:ATP-binding cassette domain-containing protein [Acetobacteraceae bacterium ESL0709]|nr:ATP-binding cassette domain-containing protein [Acetobacteraceae bacterium ESL0697]MDF7678879.1 ATP-binding cassette domain-containing protein [Acetobacteraceae bacterium ESL0709]
MSLIFENVSYHIKEHNLVGEISFTAHAGQIIALLGPNGAGKSTILDLAGGLKTPTSGKILLNNSDIGTISAYKLATMRALLAQESPLTAPFSVTELVSLAFQSLDHTLTMSQKKHLLEEVINSVGLAEKSTRNMQTLSGGERQRAHLARILLQLAANNRPTESQLLLLDEPLSAQDPAQHLMILSLIRHYVRKGGMAVIILHDLNWASAFADHIILLHQGHIYAQGPPGHVLTNATLGSVFGLPSFLVKQHKPTNRPYLIPHDMLSGLS